MRQQQQQSLIFEQFGEIEVTLPVLEQLQNVRELLMNPYSLKRALLPRIAEYQPTATADMLNLLYRTIEDLANQGVKLPSVPIYS